ncbi:WD domain protein [Ophidiomyces ophidiicola]|uniref:WD domain protein n=1 Tax=Ophidiomyces ophidiicola TaxID=1387563 RepID=UPI0020C466F3|nr:WD domain protein [Ophidiomyces ophidiicola]KAI1944399.1 WD domain protein [Ophidiomyces ophidiicola]KAI2061690.1 WD domain protein [Ophidiomyces ophidiicola]
MAQDAHPPKRRRLDERGCHSQDSSSDELGGNSDVERRRASWLKQVKTTYQSPRPFKATPREKMRSDSESPDELTVDHQAYWRRQSGAHSAVRSTSQKSSTSGRGFWKDMDDDEDKGDAEGEGDEEEENERRASSEDESDNGKAESPVRVRTPTPPPPPPPPPPKPEKLNYREKLVLRGHQRGVSAVQFSPDGTMIASCSADSTIRVWNSSTGRLIHMFEGHLAGVSTLSWSPDGTFLASGSDDKSIRLWNVLTGKQHPMPFLGHHNYIYSIAFSPKGNMLVSGSYDEAVFLWDVRSAHVMQSLPAHSDPVAGVDFIRDGTLIVSCASDGLIRIWDSATGQCLRTLVHEDNPPVTSVKFSPNGRFVLAWSLDGCVRLWNYVEGRCIKTYQGHKNEQYSISGGFGTYNAPGGPLNAFAYSGSEDGAVVCWDVVSKKILQRLEGHTDVVLGVDACSSNGKRLIVSCGMDKTIRLWEEEEEEQEGKKEEEVQQEKQEVQEQKPNEHDPDQTQVNGMSILECENQPKSSNTPQIDADGDSKMG